MSKVLVRLAVLALSGLAVKPAHAQWYPYYGYGPYWSGATVAVPWVPPVYVAPARPVYVAPPAGVYHVPRPPHVVYYR